MQIKKKILLVDDDDPIADALSIVLENAGYEVIVFTSGNELLEDAYELPDLFILDKQLAGVSGLDICERLKRQERSRHLPVMMLSATPHIGRLAKRAQADDFLEKPFKMQELLDKVRVLLVE